MDAVAEIGRNERADAGRDGRTRLARPNSCANGDREIPGIHFPCSADHEQDWQPYLVDPYSATCMYVCM